MTPDANTAEAELVDYATVMRDRDPRVRRAHAAGINKNRIHLLTGIARTTIDAILEPRPPDAPATMKLPYIVTARYAGTVVNYIADADDRADADRVAAAALAAGYHHASVQKAGPLAGDYSEVEHLTREPRTGDHVVGRVVDLDEETTGVVDHFLDDGALISLTGGVHVTFIRFDAEAVPGIHYDPADLSRTS